MKALSLTVLLSWILCQTWAQTSHSVINLKGTVVDSATGKPLAFATLVLQNSKTKSPVKNFISKDDGSFEFSVGSVRRAGRGASLKRENSNLE